MRVITGALKGRTIKPVPGDETRPTSDKVKEAVFQMLGPYFTEGHCLDLFAGSGNLGIEALSRGMEEATFIEKNPRAFKIIKENLEKLGVSDQAKIYRTDAFKALKILHNHEEKFDLILIDPPYKEFSYVDIMEQIISYGLLSEKGYIYCEHDPHDEMPDDFAQLDMIRSTTYGKSIQITIYKSTNKRTVREENEE